MKKALVTPGDRFFGAVPPRFAAMTLALLVASTPARPADFGYTPIPYITTLGNITYPLDPEGIYYTNPDLGIVDIRSIADSLADSSVTPPRKPWSEIEFDGEYDFTDILRTALSYNTGRNVDSTFKSWTIYLPRRVILGTTTAIPYLVTGNLSPKDGSGNLWSGVRIVGENRSEVIIRLKPGSSSPSSPITVLQTGNYHPDIHLGTLSLPPPPSTLERNRVGSPNMGFGNYIQNITVDIKGNPYATGIRYDVANCGSMESVSVIADTINAGNNQTGLYLTDTAGVRYIKAVQIDGGRVGIGFAQSSIANNIVLEYIRTTNQAFAGIEIDKKNIQLRQYFSSQAVGVPSIRISNSLTALTLVDSELNGTTGPTSGAIYVTGSADPFIYLLDSTAPGSVNFIYRQPPSSPKPTSEVTLQPGYVTHSNTGAGVNQFFRLAVNPSPYYPYSGAGIPNFVIVDTKCKGVRDLNTKLLDISQALREAISDAIVATQPTVIVVPRGGCEAGK